MSQLCYTCSMTVEDQVAARCTRPYCQGRKELGKDEKQAQQRKWAEQRDEENKPFDWTNSVG